MVHSKPAVLRSSVLGAPSASALKRAAFHPLRRRDESTEKRDNARMDARTLPEQEWAAQRCRVLLALAQAYVAQAAAQSNAASAGSPAVTAIPVAGSSA